MAAEVNFIRPLKFQPQDFNSKLKFHIQTSVSTWKYHFNYNWNFKLWCQTLTSNLNVHLQPSTLIVNFKLEFEHLFSCDSSSVSHNVSLSVGLSVYLLVCLSVSLLVCLSVLILVGPSPMSFICAFMLSLVCKGICWCCLWYIQ